MQQQGFSATSSHTLESLGELDNDSTLVIANSLLIHSTARIKKIQTWLEQGGHFNYCSRSE